MTRNVAQNTRPSFRFSGEGSGDETNQYCTKSLGIRLIQRPELDDCRLFSFRIFAYRAHRLVVILYTYSGQHMYCIESSPCSLVPRPSHVRHLQYEIIRSEGLVHFCVNFALQAMNAQGLGIKASSHVGHLSQVQDYTSQ